MPRRPDSERELTDVTVLAEGLAFPEGPVALDDGSVLVVEMARGLVTRVTPSGACEPVAETGGGPNGAAIGPDGALYVCNNGGYPPSGAGRVERVDLRSGRVEPVAASAGGEPLRAPNDMVFDAGGGLWFTDYGGHGGRRRVPGGIYHLAPGATEATEVVFPVDEPNGIGLSPDGSTLYWSETQTRRVVQRRIAGPGRLVATTGCDAATVIRGDPLDDSLLVAMGGNRLLDSLAVDAEGYVAVGTLVDSGISVVAPDGSVEMLRLPASAADRLPTNLCFGGADLRTAYVTLSETGRLVRTRWPRPGLRLAFAGTTS